MAALPQNTAGFGRACSNDEQAALSGLLGQQALPKLEEGPQLDGFSALQSAWNFSSGTRSDVSAKMHGPSPILWLALEILKSLKLKGVGPVHSESGSLKPG